jgi:hypothetical protein
MDHHAPGAMFVLQNCRDVYPPSNNAIFPSNLRKELHEVRSTIEAYAKTARLSGVGDANGMMFHDGMRLNVDGSIVILEGWK